MYRSLENVPLDHPLEHQLEVLDTVHTITSLRADFFNSKYGQWLRENKPRFKMFYWDDHDKFIEKLGPDVVPTEHGPYQARTVAIPALDEQARHPDALPQLTLEAAHHLVAYHVTHDDNEGIKDDEGTDGDTPLRAKTRASELVSFLQWQNMMIELHGDSFTKLYIHSEIFAGFAEYATDCFATDMFEVTERIGYIYTAMQAFRVWENDPDLTAKERRITLLMARQVLGNSLAVVDRHRNNVVCADNFMQRARPVFRQIARASNVTLKEIFGASYEY